MSGISKHFGGVAALKSVDFDLLPGEVHALVGENGAGKSTLMKVLCGVHRADSGDLEVGGRRVEFASVGEASAAGVALVPQELELFEELSVAENLFTGRDRPRKRWGGFDWPAMHRGAEEIFRSLNVDLNVRVPVKRLSAANRQLVEIGRGLLREARILILDEPTAALSKREASALFGMISGLTARGVGVVYISHRLDEVFRISDRITVMRDGRKVETASARDYSHDDLVRLMVGRQLSKASYRDGATADDVVLEARDLTRPGAFEAVSFSVREGEILGLSGLIGAGRTEVAHAIFGVDPPLSGTITVRGEEVAPRTPAEAQRLGIAYLPEERRSEGLFLPLSVSENATFPRLRRLARYGLIRTSEQKAVAEEYVQRLSVRCRSVRDPVSNLSGGNQQKVVLAKCLVNEPSILILDEPTRGVDVGAKSEIYRLIDALARDGKAVLLISSELEEILAMADRVVVMREGRVTGEFSGAEATQESLTAAAMGLTKNGVRNADDDETGGRAES
jgi:ABC-type sugar transport system ATPase subunit